MGRRGHGEGSIYQRKDGRWTAALTLDGHKRKTFYGKTRKEVQDKLSAALHEQKQGTLATGPKQLLGNYLEQWLEQVHKPTIKLITYQQYRSIVRKHLVPSLGHITLQKLTAAQVQTLYAQKLKEGLSARSVVLIHAVLHRALDNAVKWGLVARNVTTLVTLPRPQRYEAQTLTKEQAVKLLEAARGSRLEALLLVALTTGMRRGELVALRWDDVDLEHSVLFVRRTLTRIIGHGYVETEPKTKTSRRKIVLPNVAVEALRMHRDRQNEECAKAGKKWHERGIVFCNQSGGFYNPEKVDKHFQKLLKEAGLEYMRFHDLRHSAATILLMAGVHPKVVQERMGHSTIAMTMDIYSHVLPSMQQEAADKIDEMFRQ